MKHIKKLGVLFLIVLACTLGAEVAQAQSGPNGSINVISSNGTRTSTYPCYPEDPNFKLSAAKSSLVATIIGWMNGGTLAQSSSPSPSGGSGKCMLPTKIESRDSYVKNGVWSVTTTYTNGRSAKYGTMSSTNTWYENLWYGILSGTGMTESNYYYDSNMRPAPEVSFRKGSLAYTAGKSTTNITRDFKSTFTYRVPELETNNPTRKSYKLILSLAASKESYCTDQYGNGGMCLTPVPCDGITLGGLNAENRNQPVPKTLCLYTKTISGAPGSIITEDATPEGYFSLASYDIGVVSTTFIGNY